MYSDALLSPVFQIGDKTSGLDIAVMAFHRRQVDGSEPFLISDHFTIGVAPLELLPSEAVVRRAVSTTRAVACYATTTTASVLIVSYAGFADVWVSGTTLQSSAALMDVLRRQVLSADGADRRAVVSTWHYGDHGPHSDTRRIDPPEWTEIARNYPPAVASQLERLVHLNPSSEAGRLILLHGPPGTGKSTLIKTLAAAWQRWCSTHVVADPEHLFRAPNYLNHVLLTRDGSEVRPMLERVVEPDRRWKLIVAEDTDEYLRSTARHDAGASLGRLLNLTDGINTDSHDAIVLLTTNEDAGTLHPALTRPGRCLASIHFTPFSTAEARRWLPRDTPAPTGPSTLAELLVTRGDISPPGVDEPSIRNVGSYL